MQNNQKLIIENKTLLDEIFMAPSLLECIENRFMESAVCSPCNGKCGSEGGCRSM